MSDVLFGQSYYLRFDPKLERAMRPYPPLGSLWAAACVRERGCTVGFFDAMLAGSERDWEAALQQHEPRIAVLFEDNFNYLSKMCLLRMREAAQRMIKAAKGRGCRVLVCGSDATDQSSRYLASGADFVLVGEGETTLVELLGVLLESNARNSVERIAGLRFLGQDGAVHATERRPVADDLDSLPQPAWDLVELGRYAAIWRQCHGYFSLNMATTRGCPFHCNWCAKPIWGQIYHSRSAEHVVAEMAHLRDRYGVEHISFADDIMGLQPGWLQNFAAALERAQVAVPYKCLSRADLLLRDGEIEALRRSGCTSVWLGAESGSQAVLDAMDKGITVGQVEQAARQLRDKSIGVGFFLQFGYPGETRADIELTRQLLRRCAPDEIGMSVSYPLPGTKFHARVRDQLGGQRNWIDSEDLAMLYAGPFSPAFYRQLHRLVQREFRRDRARAALRDLLRHPGTVGLRHFRLLAAAIVHTLRLPMDTWRLRRCQTASGLGPDLVAAGTDPSHAATPTPQG